MNSKLDSQLEAQVMAAKHPIFETPFDTYTVVKPIGQGGSGVVYEVSNSAREALALKCLSPTQITSERLKRFKNEIEFCARNRHANIVRVIDTGLLLDSAGKRPFYVMKRYSDTLRTLMERLKPDDVVARFCQVLDGVEAAHLENVWHRDLKPENVLWCETGSELVIADFGIAHFEEDEIYTAVETRVADRMANFRYSAPEQRVRGQKVDHRADIFSLGLLLNELFTGTVPQGAGYGRIGGVYSDHAYLDEIVEHMIQQDPANRPSSIDVIKRALIGSKNRFVALQKYDEVSRQVVNASQPPVFPPISIVGVDYLEGALVLALSRKPPRRWSELFCNPQGNYSSIQGYGPEAFRFNEDKVFIGVRADASLVQQLVNFAKQYAEMANRIYSEEVVAQALEEEQRQRVLLQKATASAAFRKDLLSRVKL